MNDDRSEFIARLSRSGLMAGQDLGQWIAETGGDQASSAAELARELVGKTRLTEYQAHQLLTNPHCVLVLGNYILLDILGEGGMGVVYKARHRILRRTAALKVLAPKISHVASAVERFQREMQALAKLTHPNIVTAFDADWAGNTLYLAMEYVEGRDLWRLIKHDGPLPVDAAVDCILQAACGLEFAHAQGIVHRDIKPSNMLRDRTGTIKILDLGLARIHVEDDSAEPALTSTQAVMGTVDFMAPEQAESTHSADARSDIYSLGISLFYLLSGRIMYTGDSTLAKLLAHRDAPIPELQSPRDTVPPQLKQIFGRMVAKAPGDRYQTVTDLLADLRDFTGTESIPRITYSESGDLDPADLPLQDSTRVLGSGRGAAVEHATTVPTPDSGPRGDSRPSAGTLVLPAEYRNHIWWLLAGVLLLCAGGLKFFGPSEPPGVDAGQSGPVGQPPAAAAIANIAQPAADAVPVQPQAANKAPVVAMPAAGPGDAAVQAPDEPPLPPLVLQDPAEQQAVWAARLGVDAEIVASIGLKLRLIPPGQFDMGSTRKENADLAAMALSPEHVNMLTAELPQTRVEISQPYYLGVSEVTQGEYEDVTGIRAPAPPAGQLGLDARQMPARSVNWFSAVQFCNQLSEREKLHPYYRINGEQVLVAGGNGYRLPTDAEWEYACRAGSPVDPAAQPNAMHEWGWYMSNSGHTAHPVGKKRANVWGLYDMHGNLTEWCEDLYDFSHDLLAHPERRDHLNPMRVVRGGSWGLPAPLCRAAGRYRYHPSTMGPNLGFRIARTASPAL